MKTINVEEARTWDEDETASNIAYLDQRCRYDEVARIKALRAGEEEPVEEDDDDGPDPDAEYDSEWTAKDVAKWVNGDPERAQVALKAESKRDEPRKGLSQHLEGLVSG